MGFFSEVATLMGYFVSERWARKWPFYENWVPRAKTPSDETVRWPLPHPPTTFVSSLFLVCALSAVSQVSFPLWKFLLQRDSWLVSNHKLCCTSRFPWYFYRVFQVSRNSSFRKLVYFSLLLCTDFKFWCLNKKLRRKTRILRLGVVDFMSKGVRGEFS